MKKSALFIIGIIMGSLSFAQSNDNSQRRENMESYAKAFGIVRYYSPNPYSMEWNEFDWQYISYQNIRKMEAGTEVEDVLKDLLAIMAPKAKLTSKPKPSHRRISGDPSAYQYKLHHGSGDLMMPNYKPFYAELISCTGKSEAIVPQPDSIYCYQLSERLYLNIPLAEHPQAFDEAETDRLLEEAKAQWNKAYESYGAANERFLGMMGERSFKLSDIVGRWNMIQHFYPYHEEDNLKWKEQLPIMIEAVDSLPEGKMTKPDILNYFNIIKEAMNPVKDAHLIIYPQFIFNGAAYQLMRWYAPVLFDYKDGKLYADNKQVKSIGGIDASAVYESSLKRTCNTNADAAKDEALATLTTSVAENSPIVIEYHDTESHSVKTDTIYTTSSVPARKPYDETFARIIDDVLVINPTLAMQSYEEFKPYLDSLSQYRALLFDTRGYPSYDFHKVLAHITDKPIAADYFHLPLSCFPNREHLTYSQNQAEVMKITPATPHIDIPVYFIADHNTMSWGETVMMLVKDNNLGTIIGTNTCGTNGDATMYPTAAFSFRMTGLKVLNKDGSQYHGIGVIPDIYMEDVEVETCVKSIKR